MAMPGAYRPAADTMPVRGSILIQYKGIRVGGSFIVKRFKVNGKHARQLRENRERRATQAEFAHEISVSERKLRLIETQNDEVSADVLDRMAKAFGVPRQALVYALTEPTLVADVARSPKLEETEKKPNIVVIPRYDEDLASVSSDEAEFFDKACANDVIVSYLQTKTTAETSAYIDEFITTLEALTRNARKYPWPPVDGRKALLIQRRLRELIVLLKGNDIWIYRTTHHKNLPESNVVIDNPPFMVSERQLIIAFGPVGEYGETMVKVTIDNGHPWTYDQNALPF
jgi:transcriptional regulator with XRE-family HTH domain